MNIGQSSYANVESSQFRIIGEEAAGRVAALFNLDDLTTPTRSDFMAAWAETPLSKYGANRLEKWRHQNARRSAAKRVPVLELALIEIVSFAIAYAPDQDLCRCGFDGKLEGSERACEICEACAALGVPTFTSRDKLVADMGKALDKIEAAKAPSAAGAP